MATDSNKENLRKLLAFMNQQILHKPENAWFEKELYGILAPNADARISDIHEQCIESILRQQAEEFYKNFVIEGIKPQLINDFVKMESWRRRNNLQEFAMAAYQQIECIVNTITNDPSTELVWRNIREANFLVDYRYNDISIRYDGPTAKSIKKSIIPKGEYQDEELTSLPAMYKLKCVLFMVNYSCFITTENQKEFQEKYKQGYRIYFLRNCNHRGNDIPEENMDIIRSAYENQIYTYYRIYSYLVSFVSEVNKGYPFGLNVITFAEKCASSKV
jgi:hypothetical protein